MGRWSESCRSLQVRSRLGPCAGDAEARPKGRGRQYPNRSGGFQRAEGRSAGPLKWARRNPRTSCRRTGRPNACAARRARRSERTTDFCPERTKWRAQERAKKDSWVLETLGGRPGATAPGRVRGETERVPLRHEAQRDFFLPKLHASPPLTRAASPRFHHARPGDGRRPCRPPTGRYHPAASEEGVLRVLPAVSGV